LKRRKKMKRTVIVFLVLISVAGIAWSQTGPQSEEHSVTLEQAIDDIRTQIGLGSEERINPDEVPEMLLERLGEAVMSEIHPDESVHAWMDSMMGGEGSQSLASAHRWMGYQYLSSGSAYGYGMGRMGMMGSGMTGWYGGMNRYNSIPYDSPEAVLRQRYTRGEISWEEYRRAREDVERY
jgi:hypothetical protein